MDFTPLYDEKTIKKEFNSIELTRRQKSLAFEWIQKIKNKQLEKEVENYDVFRDTILVDLLGYPREEIRFEEKNVEFSIKDVKGRTHVVFEAKGTKTKDLFARQHYGKEEQWHPVIQTNSNMQRFAPPAAYGVCTNYNDFVLLDRDLGITKCHRFKFTDIENNSEKLKEFIGIFSYKNLVEENELEILYEKSITAEKEFTKEFYKLFHETRLMMIKEFEDNGNVTRTESVYYTQIILNRLIFMFFVEDRKIIANEQLIAKRIFGVLESDQIIDISRNVFGKILELFVAFDKGSPELGVPSFNGGLFTSSEIPNKIYFSDLKEHSFFAKQKLNSKLLKTTQLNEKAQNIINRYQNRLNPIISNLLIMESFDFNTEVNVEILGHVFEQSISDIEELKKHETPKRKKDGVYYTPEYITDYICRNTIIPYLSKSNVTRIDELITEHAKDIQELEKKFKEIKILDPACGSGAFLNKAVDIMLEIYNEIWEYKNKTGAFTEGKDSKITKWSEEETIRRIIENNIYGVDINRESIEITKLSLFLKLASENRKLSGLSKNIKVGNSLIDDYSLDHQAFAWKKEFPEVLNDLIKNPGFDIVVGNPPYVRMEEFKGIKKQLKEYETHAERSDLYVYFYEKGFQLLKEGGLFGMISSNTFIKTGYGENLKKFLQEKTQLQRVLYLGATQFFDDAITYPAIIFYKKVKTPDMSHVIPYFETRNLRGEEFTNAIRKGWQTVLQKELTPSMWPSGDSDKTRTILKKIQNNSVPFKEFFGSPLMGIKTGLNEAFVIDEAVKEQMIKKDPRSCEIIKPFLMGRDLFRWYSPNSQKYIIYTTNQTKIEDYPEIIKHLTKFKEKLEVRATKIKWWQLQQAQAKYVPDIETSKIIYEDIADKPKFSLDEEKRYVANSVYFLPSNDLYLIALLNSNLCKWFIFMTSRAYVGGFNTFRNIYVEKIPCRTPSEQKNKTITKLIQAVIDLSKEFHANRIKFMKRVSEYFEMDKVPNNIESFWENTFVEFIKKIEKKKSKKIQLAVQDEWEEYFDKYKKIINDLREQIRTTEIEIDKEIYDLYEISHDEEKIIEASLTEF